MGVRWEMVLWCLNVYCLDLMRFDVMCVVYCTIYCNDFDYELVRGSVEYIGVRALALALARARAWMTKSSKTKYITM